MKNQKLKQEDALYQDIESRIDAIKYKKNLYIMLYRLTKVIVFFAGAIITILTGFKIADNSKFNPDNYVLTISAGITLLAAMEGLFGFRDKGKGNDLLLFDLRRLRDRICFDYIKSPALYEQNKDQHFEKYQEILASQKAIIENTGDAGE